MYGNLVMLKRQNDPTFRKGIDDLAAVTIFLIKWPSVSYSDLAHLLFYNILILLCSAIFMIQTRFGL